MTLPFDWIISDTHFGHKNINRYCNRTTPAYPTPEAVDGLMVTNWNALVKPTDTILHLGDLCHWGDGHEVPMLRHLTGRKLLLKGNHDNYRDEWYADHGFEVVTEDEIAFSHSHPMSQRPFVVHLTHYPRPPYNSMVNIHGHVHNNPHHSTPQHLNVSVELTHFAPLPFDDALEKVCCHASKDITSRRTKRK